MSHSSSHSKKATITDVALEAGVATGTVSRVFNNHSDVNEEIRQRVRQAAEKLGYVRLRQRKRARPSPANDVGNIGIVCFGMEDTLVQIPIVSRALQGIEIVLSGLGRNLLFANVPKGDRVPPFLSENRVDGLILKGPNQGELPPVKENELLRQIYRVPHIWLMGRLDGARGDHCNFDSELVAKLALDHLREFGHDRIVFMNPKPGQTQFERVKRAFLAYGLVGGQKTTLLQSELPDHPSWPLPAITEQNKVDELTQQWYETPRSERATAIFVPSDRTAVQLYTALEKRGLRAGRDVSVVSCNNEASLVDTLHPGLTSIDVHAEAVGQRAVEQLMWRIRHKNEERDVQILLEPSLVTRSSVVRLNS
jgi:DNA-binding LacI/PurR family transcriptional regulator